jgi:phage anti-repressor protein
MKVMVEVKNNGVSAYDLYCFLQVKTRFSTWTKRRIHDYKFIEGEDFIPFLGESSGGRPREDLILSLDTVKEIAMVEKTDRGRQIRKYFISIEERYKNQLLRDSSKITRRDFIAILKDSGENDRQHGHAYSNYTLMIYKKLGIEYTKHPKFRDSLSAEQLSAVENLERLAEAYIKMGYDYYSIKNALPECILEKENIPEIE